ncbi:pyridoxal phosphate-dependent aminotransferase [Chromatocurvus halotolerans]|nr:pyridoxal phosphate-dependent aminotransferase [Chromatocurvus halotolerans]
MPAEHFAARFSHRMRAFADDEDGVWAVHDTACERHAKGENIYLLSIGDPDLPTLPSTIEATIDSLRDGRTHYAPGRGELRLRRVIADIEARASGRACDPDEIIIFPGATNAIYTTLACITDPGDAVVVAEPMYVGYDGIFKALGIAKSVVPLDAQAGFRLDPEAVKAAVTSDTRAVLLNTPGNPAGNMIDAETLSSLASWCRDNGLWLVCDEVYSMITFERRHVSLRRAAAALDNVVVIDSLSKSHAMTGWRLGWTVSSLDMAERLLDFTSATVFGCCQFVQDAAAFALTNDEAYIADVRDEYRKRRDYLCGRIDAVEGLSCVTPEAGMFVMMDVSGSGRDGAMFARELLDRHDISVLPGAGFGPGCGQFVRVSLCQPVEVLAPALDRMERYMNECRRAKKR